MTDPTRGCVARIRRALAETSAVDLALRLTLLDLLLQPVGDWRVRPAVLALTGLGLLFPAALRKPRLWWGLTLLTGARVLLDYPLPDNHAYLLCYWCMAVALALSAADTDAFLAANGRWLVGLVFAFATLWKLVLSPDFSDGTFFRVSLLVDPRFEDLTRLLGRVPLADLDTWRGLLESHSDGAPLAMAVPALPAGFGRLADAMTLWTVAIEGLLAVTFLWPGKRGPARLRDAALLAFCATTYAAATVEGFGWLLIAMASAHCPPERVRTRALYLAAFALILFYREVPWTVPLLAWAAPDSPAF